MERRKMNMVFGYLYGRHIIQRSGRLLSERVEELPDGSKVLVKTYELLEEEILAEQPWMMETQAGKVHVCVPEPLTEEIEKLAPAGFEVIWRAQPIKRRGRKPKATVQAPANAIANGKVEGATIAVEDEDEFDDGDEELISI